MKSLFTTLALFVFSIGYSLNITINPTAFGCGTYTVSGNTGCSSNGTLQVSADGNPAGLTITSVSAISGGNFLFNINVSPGVQNQATLIFTILTTDDPTGCALPNATQNITIILSCSCNTVITSMVTHESCFQCQNGAVAISVFGATAPVVYLWSNGATTNSVVNLVPGTYTVTATDANNCIAIESVNISAYQCTPFTVNGTVTNAVCHNDCNGSIQLGALSNGSTAYAVLWSQGQTGTFLQNLCASAYQLTVTATDNCTAIRSFDVLQPNPITITLEMITHATANAGGHIVFSLTGIDPGAFCESCDAQGICAICGESEITSATTDELPAGCYTLVMTNPNGCIGVSAPACIDDVSAALDLSQSDGIKIYPNPTRDLITIGNQGILNAESDVIILDIIGRVCMRPRTMSNIDVSSLDTGMYFIQLKNNGHVLNVAFNKL